MFWTKFFFWNNIFVAFAFSEDILNYEIGDVDADDTDLTGADEDELLLSDDGNSIHCHALPFIPFINFMSF